MQLKQTQKQVIAASKKLNPILTTFFFIAGKKHLFALWKAEQLKCQLGE